MALYRIYYSTMPHIKEYDEYITKKQNYGIKLSDKTVEKPVSIKAVDKDVLAETKSILKEKLFKNEITSSQYKEVLNAMALKDAKETFDKEEVDASTSMFKNEDEFIKHLIRSDLNLNKEDILRASQNGRENKILAVYKNRGKFKELELIYNNRVLRKIAVQMIRRKQNGDKGKKIILTKNIEKDYYEYTDFIKKYLTNLTNNKKLANKFKKNEEYNQAHKSFRIAIEKYAEYKRALQRSRALDDGAENIELKEEIEHYSREIDKLMLNYDIFREVALWEQRITQHEKTMEELEQEAYAEEFKEDLMNSIYMTAELGGKDAVLNKYKIKDLNIMPKSFLEEYKINLEKLKKEKEKKEFKQLEFYKDDIIYDYYNAGGAAAIINNFDITELRRYPKVVLDEVGVHVDGVDEKDYEIEEKRGRTK